MFGESPPDNSSAGLRAGQSSSSGLFGDETAAPVPASNKSNASGLFAENDANDSPWSLPTPKKQNRQNFVKNLLPATQVPDSYIDAYDLVLDSEGSRGAGVSLIAVQNLLASSGLSASDQDRISTTVLPAGQQSASSLERGEFNVLLALVGLGQEGEEITLDSVDERRKRALALWPCTWNTLTIFRPASPQAVLSRRLEVSCAVN